MPDHCHTCDLSLTKMLFGMWWCYKSRKVLLQRSQQSFKEIQKGRRASFIFNQIFSVSGAFHSFVYLMSIWYHLNSALRTSFSISSRVDLLDKNSLSFCLSKKSSLHLFLFLEDSFAWNRTFGRQVSFLPSLLFKDTTSLCLTCVVSNTKTALNFIFALQYIMCLSFFVVGWVAFLKFSFDHICSNLLMMCPQVLFFVFSYLKFSELFESVPFQFL